MKHVAIIFDLDGTLVDSLPDLAAAVNRMLKELRRPPLPRDKVARMVGDGAAKLVERALAASGLAATPLQPQLDRFLAFYEANATSLTRPYPGVPEILEELRAAGLRLSVCTNKPQQSTRAVLSGLDLERFFPVVIGGDSQARKKPDPEPILVALDRLGVARQDAVMVGDHRNDVAAAQAAGIRSIFASYGYGAETLKTLSPDAVIERFADLPAALDVIGRSPSGW